MFNMEHFRCACKYVLISSTGCSLPICLQCISFHSLLHSVLQQSKQQQEIDNYFEKSAELVMSVFI